MIRKEQCKWCAVGTWYVHEDNDREYKACFNCERFYYCMFHLVLGPAMCMFFTDGQWTVDEHGSYLEELEELWRAYQHDEIETMLSEED